MSLREAGFAEAFEKMFPVRWVPVPVGPFDHEVRDRPRRLIAEFAGAERESMEAEAYCPKLGSPLGSKGS